MDKLPKNFHSGLSGIQLPVPKYQFPAEYQNRSRLSYYASLFNSIEVNNSFYKIPMKNTLHRWAAEVPDDFAFTFKLYREVTHCKDLFYDPNHISQFMATIAAAQTKSACVLVQFPPSLTPSAMHQLEHLLQQITASNPATSCKVAVEFRNSAWYNTDTYDLLESNNSTLVRHDIPRSATPSTELAGDTAYVRFHGPTGNYGGSYSAAFLHEYASYVKEWLAEGRTVFVYFNNTKGDAYNNLRTFNSFVSEA